MHDQYGRPELYLRLKRYSLQTIELYFTLARSGPAAVIGNQLLRSGMSPGAQYSEAQRAKSNREFISKIEGALQELEESRYWLELLLESQVGRPDTISALIAETTELIKILVTIARRAKSNN